MMVAAVFFPTRRFPVTERPSLSLLSHFRDLPDPRVERTREHLLLDIIAIAVCAVVGGADDWVAIETFAHAKYDWFARFLTLPNGIPSHDTFGRVFARLDPTRLAEGFQSWMATSSVRRTIMPRRRKSGMVGVSSVVVGYLASRRGFGIGRCGWTCGV
jgi:hypothetical protein